MEVQYVYDEEGRRTGVLVPITLWNKISHLAVARDEKTDWDPTKYRGMYKNLKVDVVKESKTLRDEWARM
jgi:hypothetical protein